MTCITIMQLFSIRYILVTMQLVNLIPVLSKEEHLLSHFSVMERTLQMLTLEKHLLYYKISRITLILNKKILRVYHTCSLTAKMASHSFLGAIQCIDFDL